MRLRHYLPGPDRHSGKWTPRSLPSPQRVQVALTLLVFFLATTTTSTIPMIAFVTGEFSPVGASYPMSLESLPGDVLITEWGVANAAVHELNQDFSTDTVKGTSSSSGNAGVAALPDGRIMHISQFANEMYVHNRDGSLNISFSATVHGCTDADAFNYAGNFLGNSGVTDAGIVTRRGQGGGNIPIYDLNTGTLVGSYSAGFSIYSGSVVSDLNEYWAFGTGSIAVFDLYSRQLLRTISLSGQTHAGQPECSQYSSQTQTIVSIYWNDGRVFERNTDATASVVRIFAKQGSEVGVHGVARRPDTLDVYTISLATGNVYRFSQTGTSTPINIYNVGFTQPSSISFVNTTGDSIHDAENADLCPEDDNKTSPGQCGCGVADADTDGDSVADCVDNCPSIANADQASTNPTSAGDACFCVLEDETCNYDVAPPVVTFSDVVIGDDDLAYYRIQMNASAHWDEYVKVVFPNSNQNFCDYPASQNTTWSVVQAADSVCMNMYSVDIRLDDFLGECGFEQVARSNSSSTFHQTVQILTNRTCEDGRINQLSLSSDVELSETRAITRETQFEIEIAAPVTTTASVGGLEVFGAAFKLELLGDLTITPDIDTNMPTISGFFVTETQHPYELQEPVFELTGDFNYATFELTGTYCTADNSTRLPCQQTWSYSFQPNQTCPDKAQLEGELVQVTWNVNCSDGFIGECAPSFAVQPEATFTLNSPIYCFSSDYIELTPSLEVYQFDQLTANSANFGASTLGTLTDNGFSVERVFTIDSQLYAEYTVVAAGTGVTLTATTLKKVSTTTSSRGELVLYETNAAEQVITQATTFSVHDTGFGTDESSDFADYRTRFQFTWLNDTTVLLDSTEDLAQTIALSATTISIFTNVESLRKAGIDERHPVLSKLNSEHNTKERENRHVVLFADDHNAPRDSKTTVLARLAPASTTTTPAASTASSGFVVSPTVAAAGIALIAVVALVALAVVRRNRSAAAVSKVVSFSAPSSSSVDLSTNTIQLTSVSSLETVASLYDVTIDTAKVHEMNRIQ
jgi:hypothetical protein